jgi:hypothetical protein
MTPGHADAPAPKSEGTATTGPLAGDASSPPKGSADPTVTALIVHGTKRTRDLVVACPWCERIHCHGWPWSSGEPGHRVGHCTRVRDELTGRWRSRRPAEAVDGYTIVIGPGTKHTGVQAVAS